MLPFPMRSLDSPAALGLQHIALEFLKSSNLLELSEPSKLAATGAWG
jgi:hypothetical protein